MAKIPSKKGKRPKFTTAEKQLIGQVVLHAVVELNSLDSMLRHDFPRNHRLVSIVVQQLKNRAFLIQYLEDLLLEDDFQFCKPTQDAKVLTEISLLDLWDAVLQVGRVAFKPGRNAETLHHFGNILQIDKPGVQPWKKVEELLMYRENDAYYRWERICRKVRPYLEWLDEQENQHGI